MTTFADAVRRAQAQRVTDVTDHSDEVRALLVDDLTSDVAQAISVRHHSSPHAGTMLAGAVEVYSLCAPDDQTGTTEVGLLVEYPEYDRRDSEPSLRYYQEVAQAQLAGENGRHLGDLRPRPISVDDVLAALAGDRPA